MKRVMCVLLVILIFVFSFLCLASIVVGIEGLVLFGR